MIGASQGYEAFAASNSISLLITRFLVGDVVGYGLAAAFVATGLVYLVVVIRAMNLLEEQVYATEYAEFAY